MPLDDAFLLGNTARAIINKKVSAVCRRREFAHMDRDDLHQQLLVELLQNLPKFNSARGTPHAFAKTVVDRAIGMMLRRATSQKRDAPLIALGDHSPPDERPVPDTDLQMDVADVLARLPPALQDLAKRLMRDSVSDVARDLGVPRSSLQRKIAKIRDAMNKSTNSENPCVKSPTVRK